jgi:F-type H+-transporting ATPase subunit epsilon
MDANSRTLQCVVVTPERAVLDEPADFVALPMYDGELGVLPGRAPLIGRLGFGELRIRQGVQTQHYFIEGGFAQVRQNTVTVLTQRAQRAEDINPEAAAQALAQALAPAATEAARSSQVREQERARAQLRVVHRLRGEATA